ncbi:hypothetical protein RRG08_003860 [Elysia crispata]|uniref:Uncharacterized protein n=1 Tax=Elysia crispata TaxID=231223 RepID=A0AAE0ZDV4_9GAST|nr:hypothetical protein RRG08_003860 [Elysia crispata]
MSVRICSTHLPSPCGQRQSLSLTRAQASSPIKIYNNWKSVDSAIVVSRACFKLVPDVARRQPGVARRQPDVARRQPDVARRQPDVARRQPGVARRQPDVARRQPGVASVPTNKCFIAILKQKHSEKA